MKKIFRSNTILYNLYFYLIRKNKNKNIKIPQLGDMLYVDGYPRSANTFFVGALEYVFMDHFPKFASHHHTIAALKIALKKNINSFIMLRAPSDAVASLYILHDFHGKIKKNNEEKHMNDLLKQYLDYYVYVSKQTDKVKIVMFEDITENPILKLNEVRNMYNLSMTDDDINNRFEQFKINFKKRQDGKHAARTSGPNKYRYEKKQNLVKLIKSLPDYNLANKIFEDIKYLEFNK